MAEKSFNRLQYKMIGKEDKTQPPFTRQTTYEDLFSTLYEKDAKILKPTYDPGKMYEVYEESGVVRACIEAIVSNVDGYGYRISPRKGSELDTGDADRPEKERLENFFDSPNGIDSFLSLREKLRRDLEVTGNGFLEIVRDKKGLPHMLFWMDSKRVRLLPIGKEQVETTVTIERNGKLIQEKVYRQFRKFVMIDGESLVYFKENMDPRMMDARTGEYISKIKKDTVIASEVLHFKEGNSTYGVPRWIGTVLTAMGTANAEYVNYDLFEGQALPPLIITVAGGELTDESFEDLLTLLKRSQGVKNFHKVVLLEAESTSMSPDGKSAIPKIEVQDLMAFRKEDSLFSNYLNQGRESVRMYGFRLPGIFTGDHTGVNFSTAKVSRELAEEQLFIPLRRKFDDLINNTIVRDLGAKTFMFKSNGPVIKSSQDVITIFPQLMKSNVFSLNELVQFTNENFGLNVRLYDEEWANLPIGLLLSFFQSLGMAVGNGVGDGKGLPNILGGMQPAVDMLQELSDRFLGSTNTEAVQAPAQTAENEE